MKSGAIALLLVLILSNSGMAAQEGATQTALAAPSRAATKAISITHPRLWITNSDLPRLREWATSSNPVYRDGILVLAQRAKMDMDRRDVPARDCGSTEYEEYPTEMYAELFAFMSLIETDLAARNDYANRARTLLMAAIDQANLGPTSQANYTCPSSGSTGYPPFRAPHFFTEDSNRARWHGEAFPLVVDWIYPSLTVQDKQKIRNVFLRWSGEIITRGYHAPSPVGTILDPVLLNDASQVRWAGNNYFTAHMRNLGLMALSLDAADDAGNQLRNHLDNATGSWLYIFDHLTRTDSQGGFLPEGFEYSPQTASYAIQFLLALRTAGADTCGQHCQIQPNRFWDDFVAAYFHSLSPATINDPSYGQLYQPAWYGDAQAYRTSDFIDSFGALGIYDNQAGNSSRLQSLRWAETNAAPGGASEFSRRISNTDNFRGAILYFMLFDPNVAAAADPRPNLAQVHFASGLNKFLSRTGWDAQATWFNYNLSWNLIDHQQANGNHFEWYRKGEWLTKARTGYADIAEGIASSEFSNTLAVENDRPARDSADWRTDLWQRGSQWNYVSSGNPQLLAGSDSASYAYLMGDATPLYNSSSEHVTDVLHASRSIVWLKPDTIITYDRARTASANRFKRWWLQLPRAATVNGSVATMTSPGGQTLAITSLLPVGAVMSAVNTTEAHVAGTVATDEPMSVRLKVEAPGNPSDVRFLEVLQASDGGASRPTVSLLQSADKAWSGAQIGTSVVMFPVSIDVQLTSMSYTAATTASTHIITGLSANAAYSASVNGAIATVQQGGNLRSDGGGVLQFTSGSTQPPPPQPVASNPNSPQMIVNNTSEAIVDASGYTTLANPVHFTFSFPGCSQAELHLAMSAPEIGLPWSYLDSSLNWRPLPATLSQITPFASIFGDNGTQQELFNGHLPAGTYDIYLVCDTRNGKLDIQNLASGPSLTGMYVHRKIRVR